MKPFNRLTPKESELLALLAEECGEVIQAIGKILRHGLDSRHPDGGPTNIEALEAEIGHTRAATWMLCEAILNRQTIQVAHEVKLASVRRFLHHFDDYGAHLQEAPELRPDPFEGAR